MKLITIMELLGTLLVFLAFLVFILGFFVKASDMEAHLCLIGIALGFTLINSARIRKLEELGEEHV